MKLLKEMPKIAKCLKLRNSIDFKDPVCNKPGRSDTIILGILAHFRQFRHFSE